MTPTGGKYDLVIKLGKPLGGLVVDTEYEKHLGTWIRVPFDRQQDGWAAGSEIEFEVVSNVGTRDYPYRADEIGCVVLQRTDERAA